MQDKLRQAIDLHRSGSIDAAMRLYQEVLEGDARNADARHLLGVVLMQKGNPRDAIEQMRQSIELRPNDAETHGHLAMALEAAGEFQPAVNCYQKSLELNPSAPEPRINLAWLLHKLGRTDEGIALLTQQLQRDPNPPQSDALRRNGTATMYRVLATMLRARGQIDEAINLCRRSIELNPDSLESNYDCATALAERGRFDEALQMQQRILATHPNFARSHSAIAFIYREIGNYEKAGEHCRKAIALDPNLVDARINYGNVLQDQGQLDAAISEYRFAMKLGPSALTVNNLANALKGEGRLEEALDLYRQAIGLMPTFAELHSNLLFGMLFSDRETPQTLATEHRKWVERHARSCMPTRRVYRNSPDPDRPLRIGYVSCDFRNHVVGRNFWPVLQHHDREQFHVHCYFTGKLQDSWTGMMRQRADRWHDVTPLSDDAFAKLVEEEEIDILVDLVLHMAYNRQRVFARKPAPVQMSHMGYPASSGLPTIDWRVTDRWLDPTDENVVSPSERLARLNSSFWCYHADGDDPPISDLPARRNGFVTFGSLNNPCKVTPSTIKLWAQVLQAVPDARLMVLVYDVGGVNHYFESQFASHGIGRDRLNLAPIRGRKEYLQLYHSIDVGLDPIPYGGHSTSCDSFYMGVPVLTLAGNSSVSRAGVSLLQNLRLPQFIAPNEADFVSIAARVARDLEGLAKLRATLRNRMQASPLMDEVGYTRDLERLYREAWRSWCSEPRPTPPTAPPGLSGLSSSIFKV